MSIIVLQRRNKINRHEVYVLLPVYVALVVLLYKNILFFVLKDLLEDFRAGVVENNIPEQFAKKLERLLTGKVQCQERLAM